MKNYHINQRIVNLLFDIHHFIGEDRFIFYGGAALDILLDLNSNIHDLDIGIEGLSRKRIRQCRNNLLFNGFRIIAERDYFINIIDPVYLIYASNITWFLDIAFLEKYNSVGQFDIESLYIRFPELDYVDNYNAIEAAKSKTITPIRDLQNENPYLLISRLIHLSSKYQISLANSPENMSLISRLNNLIKTWEKSDNFHGPLAKASTFSSVLKAIINANNRASFIKDLVTSNSLVIIAHEIHGALNEFDNLDPFIKRAIIKCCSKKELVAILLKIVDKNHLDVLIKRIESLNLRTWDHSDKNLTANLLL